MWECCRGVGGSGWIIFWSKIGSRPSEARYLISVVDHQMAQLHKIDRAPDRKTACTGIWVLDTGMTKHGAPSLVVSKNNGVNGGVGRVSRNNKRDRKHKIVSVRNANSQLCYCRTLDGSTLECSAIGFDIGIITYTMRSIDGWIRLENHQEQAKILEV